MNTAEDFSHFGKISSAAFLYVSRKSMTGFSSSTNYRGILATKVFCRYIINYAKTREVYAAYRKAGYSKARNEMQELVRAQKNVERFFAEEKTVQENEQAR